MPFADALTPLLARLRARYAQTPLPRFFQWWWAELRACLPARWQEVLAAQEAAVLLHLDGGRVRIERAGASGAVLLLERDASEAPIAREEFDALLGERGQRAPRIALLPANACLVRRLTIPAAAVANARNLAGFEIDRQTPFRPDQVQFDCQVRLPEAGSKLTSVDIAVVPNESLQRCLQPLAALAGQIDAVDVARGAGRAGFNLLPAAQRRAHDQRPLLINLALAGFAASMLLLAMSQLVDNRLQAVAGMQDEVELQRDRARATAQLRKSLDEAATAANFLAGQKDLRPSMVELLKVLTDTLPDDTFVERMSFTGDTLSLSVQSSSAAKLVELFQAAPSLRNPALAGPIMPDPRSGKDRATLTAQFGPAPDADRKEAP